MVTKALTHLQINYLDASAAVKLVLDEPPGSDRVTKYFHEHSGFHITSLCLAEALGVLKREVLKPSMKEQYFRKCSDLLAYVRGKPKSIQLDDIQLSDLSVFTET